MYFESFLSIKRYRQQDNQHLKDTDYKTWIKTKVIPRRLCVLTLLPNFFNYLSWIESQTPVSHQIA